MSFRCLFFIGLSMSTILFSSYVDGQMGLLEKAEYDLWDNSNKKPSFNSIESFQSIEDESISNAIDCQTKIVNCCCVSLASLPFLLCITSFFID